MISELLRKNKDNLFELEFKYDFSKVSTEKIEYNLFGNSLIFEVHEHKSLITEMTKSEENYTPGMRLNVYKKNGDTVLKGAPILNYTDLILPLRSNEEFKDIYVTSVPVSIIGLKSGVTIKNLGKDNVLVAFNNDKEGWWNK